MSLSKKESVLIIGFDIDAAMWDLMRGVLRQAGVVYELTHVQLEKRLKDFLDLRTSRLLCQTILGIMAKLLNVTRIHKRCTSYRFLYAFRLCMYIHGPLFYMDYAIGKPASVSLYKPKLHAEFESIRNKLTQALFIESPPPSRTRAIPFLNGRQLTRTISTSPSDS